VVKINSSIFRKRFLLTVLLAVGMLFNVSSSSAAPVCEDLFSSTASIAQNSLFQNELKLLENRYGAKLTLVQDQSPRGLKYLTLIDSRSGRLVGELNYRYNEAENNLSILWMESFVKKIGVARALVGAALSAHPDTAKVSTEVLVDTNENLVKGALARGLKLEQAIQETAVFKISASFGFGKLVPDSINVGYGFTVVRP
jgi:hypothetical protein